LFQHKLWTGRRSRTRLAIMIKHTSSRIFGNLLDTAQRIIFDCAANPMPPTRNETISYISCQLSDFLQDTFSLFLYDSENDFIQPNGYSLRTCKEKRPCQNCSWTSSPR